MSHRLALESSATPYRIAILTAIACVLQISESMIPHPVPGLRLGLANMITLVALIRWGGRAAMEIAVLRTILSSLIIGTFMSPTFILSFFGALVSTFVMWGLLRFVQLQPYIRFSIIGISIAGALIHNMVQLYLAYALLVKHRGIFIFFPWLCVGSVIMGWITGAVAGQVCQRLGRHAHRPSQRITPTSEEDSLRLEVYNENASYMHRLSPEIKIFMMMAVAIFLFWATDYRIFVGLFLLMLVIVITSGISFKYLYTRLRRFSVLIALPIVLSACFNHGSDPIVSWRAVVITREGLLQGSIVGLRLVLLILFSTIVMRTTSPEGLTKGVARLMKPFRYLGVSEQRTAQILTTAWEIMPDIWQKGRQAIRSGMLAKTSGLKNMIPMLSMLITDMMMGESDEQDDQCPKPDDIVSS